jgi:hypothetical protein
MFLAETLYGRFVDHYFSMEIYWAIVGQFFKTQKVELILPNQRLVIKGKLTTLLLNYL